MTSSTRKLRTNPHLRQHSVNALVGAEMTKHGQSRALPLHQIVAEMTKYGQSRALPLRPIDAELTKHGQSRALPLRPIGRITELPKNGRPHRVAPTVVGWRKCVINEWLRTNRQIAGGDDPIAPQDAHKWTVIGRGDPVWSPANYAQNCIKAVGVDDPIALRIAHKLTNNR